MAQTHHDVIRQHIDQNELLAQLAEEATELAHAALKLRRANMATNPTPVAAADAYANLMEELADVRNCVSVLGFDRVVDQMHISRVCRQKMERWADRLKNT